MTIYGRSEELVSRCVECDLAEPESLASLGGSAPGLVDGILSEDEDDGEDDVIELFLELVEEAISDDDDEDEECNIQSTNVDSSSNSWLMDVRSCLRSSVVLHR